MEKLGLNQNVIDLIIQEFQQLIPTWQELIGCSFVSPNMQEKYIKLLEKRSQRLNLLD